MISHVVDISISLGKYVPSHQRGLILAYVTDWDVFIHSINIVNCVTTGFYDRYVERDSRSPVNTYRTFELILLTYF